MAAFSSRSLSLLSNGAPATLRNLVSVSHRSSIYPTPAPRPEFGSIFRFSNPSWNSRLRFSSTGASSSSTLNLHHHTHPVPHACRRDTTVELLGTVVFNPAGFIGL
jgi:hypothetical protein